MTRVAKLLMLLVGIATLVPIIPSTAEAQPYPPHVRRRRRYIPPPPPPPKHVRRRRPKVVHHHHHQEAKPRPRKGISDPRTSIYFGIGPVASIVADGSDGATDLINSGGGLEMFLGLRFSKYAAFELGGLFTFHDTDDIRVESGVLSGMTGDIKVFFVPKSRRIEPFLQVGAGLYLFSRDNWDDNELTGGGFQFGGGVDIRVNRMIAIGTRALYRGIYLDNSDASYWTGAAFESSYMNVFSLSANLQIHF